MPTKVDILRGLINALCNGNASAFARAMGLRQSTVATWLARGTMDYDKIVEAYPQVSAEWLLRGTGSVLNEDSSTHHHTPVPGESNTPLSEVAELRAEVAELRERCARLTDALLRMHEDVRE